MQSVLGDLLQGLLADTGWCVTKIKWEQPLGQGVVADAVVHVASGAGAATLVVEMKAHSRAGEVRKQALLLKHEAGEGEAGRPVAVAVFVHRVTVGLAGMLREAGVGYFDLFGACYLRWPGLFIERPGGKQPIVSLREGGGVEGVEAVGVFGSRAVRRHRVLRALLSYPRRRWHQVELAKEAEVSAYTAHTVVAYLLGEHYVDYEGRGPEKVVFLVRPGDLIETWATFWRDVWQRYRKGAKVYHSLARNTDEVIGGLREAAGKVGARLGLTLAAGANQYGAYLFDEVVHAYLIGDDESLAEAADLDAARRAGNVVLYGAADPGLMYLPGPVRDRLGRAGEKGCSPVSPVQLYLDMRAAGGRYAEQAERLRQEMLGYE